MGSVIGQVEEIGLAVALVAVEELDGIVGESIRRIIRRLRRRQFGVVEREPAAAVGPQIAAGPGQDAVETVEAALKGPFLLSVHTQMPLAGHVGMIARALQHLGDRYAVPVEITLISGRLPGRRIARFASGNGVLGHAADAGLVGIQTRHQAGPRGT